MSSHSGNSGVNTPSNSIFMVLEGGSLDPALPYVGIVPEQSRKKRAHRKSRRGCVECKRRRVKCDENVPCSNCIKRRDRCVRSVLPEDEIGPSLSSPHFETDADPQLNLLHHELFNHFEKETVSTLSFPEIWSKLLQQSFHDEYIMSTMLCTAASHLSVLSPRVPKYSTAALQFLSKSLRLLRQNLSQPFTKENADALMGCSILMTYISWSNLDFLNAPGGTTPAALTNGLDLSLDQLFLLSSGVRHVYFQALPVFLTEQSSFISITYQHPRLNIEDALSQRGEDPARFMKPLMELWDDPRFQTCRAEPPSGVSASRNSWLFFVETEAEMAWEQVAEMLSGPTPTPPHGPFGLEAESPTVADTPSTIGTGVTSRDTPPAPRSRRWGCPRMKPHANAPEPAIIPPLDLQKLNAARTGYELVARRLSPILCCVSPLTGSVPPDAAAFNLSAVPDQADFRRMFFASPILLCGPFLEMVFRGDTRALVLLFHFYRSARVLLPTRESWWAHERSRVMEGLILKELRDRGVGSCLRPRDST